MRLWRFLALAFLGVAVAVLITAWYFPTTTDFRTRNPFWNGLDRFLSRYDATPLSSLAELPEDPRGTMLVVIPYTEPTGADLQLLKAYTEEGGTLLLADDWAFGNTVLMGLGVPARFSGAPLLDPLFNDGDRRFPVVSQLTPSPLTAGVSSLVLNYATTLEGSGFTVLARSSAFSYLDLSRNGAYDLFEPVGPLPVVGHTPVGDGHLVLLSDPSLLINVMLDARDNIRFTDNLVGIAGPQPQVLVDQAHLPTARLDETKGALVTARKVASNPASVAALTAALAVVLMMSTWPRKGEPD